VAGAVVFRLRRSLTAIPRFRRVITALDDAAARPAGSPAGRQAAERGAPR
jgi:hypothetical protein